MRFIQRLSFLPVFIVFITSLYAQDVHYNYDHGANFGAYKTYQWVDLPGPGGAVPDQLIDQSIKRAVDEQLGQKGLTRADKDADLYVSYHTIVREEKASTCRHLVTAAAPGDGAAVGADSIAVQ